MRCIVINNRKGCEEESGDEFVCDGCRKYASDYILNEAWKTVREIMLALACTPWEKFICYHCGEEHERERIAVDHFPKTRKGIRCREMWNIFNLVPSDQACNTSGNAHRSASMRGKYTPLQQFFIDSVKALRKGIDDLFLTRQQMKADGVKTLPPIHEHILIIARSVSIIPPSK